MSDTVNIANVSVQKSATDHELITLHQFLKKPAMDRFNLVKDKKVEFIDYNGDKINTLLALKEITELIKSLRKEGTLSEMMHA